MTADLDFLVEEAVRDMEQQIEYELRGAWRAGYSYVHVFDDVRPRSEPGTVRLTQHVLPTNVEQPPDPVGLVYRHTFDIDSVPDEQIREAVRASYGAEQEEP